MVLTKSLPSLLLLKQEGYTLTEEGSRTLNTLGAFSKTLVLAACVFNEVEHSKEETKAALIVKLLVALDLITKKDGGES